MKSLVLMFFTTTFLAACSHKVETSNLSKNQSAQNQQIRKAPYDFSRVPASQLCARNQNFSIALHGGLGGWGSSEKREQRQQFILQLLRHNQRALQNGHSALSVVQEAAVQLENSGLFNAGKASVKNENGQVEMDASIMDGRTLKSGAVAGIRNFKNPILVASEAMKVLEHDFFIGPGADQIAEQAQLETVTPDYFQVADLDGGKHKYGTIGAVALDRCGNLAAATSTGGLAFKKEGRVGDSPIIGAGTFADNATVAVSATGRGEDFIRTSAAAFIAHSLELNPRYRLRDAVNASLQRLTRKMRLYEPSGGFIAISKSGEVVIEPAGVAGGYATERTPPALR